MKTIEIAVRIVAQVDDDVAKIIEADPEKVFIEFPLEQVQLMRSKVYTNIVKNATNNILPAKFCEHETMNIEQLSE